MIREILRLVPRYTVTGLFVLVTLVTMLVNQSFGTDTTHTISIPVTTVIFKPAGSLTEVASANVAANLQGKTCNVVATAINQESVHPNNDLIISSPGGSGTITLANVERSVDAVTTANGQMTFGSKIVVTLKMGSDGVFSAGFNVDITANCVDPDIQVCRNGDLITIKESQRLPGDTNPPCPAVVACTNLTVASIDLDTRSATITSTSKNATILGYKFRWGDGTATDMINTAANSASKEHTYAKPGEYKIGGWVVYKDHTGATKEVHCPEKTTIVEDEPKTYDVSLKKYVKNSDGEWVDANNPATAPAFQDGSNVSWRIVVSNDGQHAVSGLKVKDILPTGVSYVSHSGSGSFDTNTAVWTIGNLNSGASATLEVVTKLASVSELTTRTNWAGVSAMDQVDVDSTPNDAIDGNQDDEDPASVKVSPTPPQLGCIGDRVWLDTNKNGTQDSGEANVANVVMQLKNAQGAVIATTKTNQNGIYSFCELPAGTYYVTVVVPVEHTLTSVNNGSNDELDSDFATNNATSPAIQLPAGGSNLTIDAGLVSTAAQVSCSYLEILGQTATTVTVKMHANVSNAAVQAYIFKVNDQVVQQTGSDTYTFKETTPGNYKLSAQVVTDKGTSQVGNCVMDIVVETQPVVACSSLSVIQLSRTEFKLSAVGFTSGNASIKSFDLVHDDHVLGTSENGQFTLKRDIVGDYQVKAYVNGVRNGENVRLTSDACSATITVHPEDIPPAVHACTGLNITQHSQYRFSFAPSFTPNTHVKNYRYLVNSKEMQNGSTATLNWTASKAGSYSIKLIATVMQDDNKTTEITCVANVFIDNQPGAVLGHVDTPPQLPNTGISSLLPLLASILAISFVYGSHLVADHLYTRQFKA